MPRFPSVGRRDVRRWRTAVIDGIKDAVLWMQLALGLSNSQSDASGRYHILVVDDLLPDPLLGAGYPRAFAIVRSLADAGHLIDFYPMHAKRVDALRMTSIFDNHVHFHRGEGARGLRRLLWRTGWRFDVLFVSRPTPMAALIAADRRRLAVRHRPSVIYDAEAVIAPREARRRALFGPPWSESDCQTALAEELTLASRAQAVTAVGVQDAAVIASRIMGPVFVLPHPVSPRVDIIDFGGRDDLLFVGRLTGEASESPNVDSVRWFVTEVMPQLDRHIGTEYRLHIAGRVEAAEIQDLASDRVILHGIVENLRPLYDGCRLFVAPTRYAAGIPLKVVEAMGEGIPCVATPLLAEQLGAGVDVLATGERGEEFAAQCARLYCDAEAWRDAQAAGLDYVMEFCSPAAFDRTLAQVIDHVVNL